MRANQITEVEYVCRQRTGESDASDQPRPFLVKRLGEHEIVIQRLDAGEE